MDKNVNGITFQCCVCGEELPAGQLAWDVVRRNNTGSRTRALMVLDPDELVCSLCHDAQDEAGLREPAPFGGRTDQERFEFSGITPDPGKLQAYLLSN